MTRSADHRYFRQGMSCRITGEALEQLPIMFE